MASSLVRLDDEVIAEVIRRATGADSHNGRLRQIFGMPPPRKRGWLPGQKRQGSRGKKKQK